MFRVVTDDGEIRVDVCKCTDITDPEPDCPLHLRFRPRSWDEIDAAIRSIKS